MAITIKKVSTKRELKKFIRFNYRMHILLCRQDRADEDGRRDMRTYAGTDGFRPRSGYSGSRQER